MSDAEKPDTSIPSRLRLSGNHRISLAPDEFEKRMHAIVDTDLWGALDPSMSSLAPVAEARDRGDMDGAARAWKRHCASRADAARLYALTGMPGRPFLSPGEYRAALGPREDLRAEVIRQAEDVAHHKLGSGRFVHQFGDEVDFNHDFGTPGMKYGLHYWPWGVPLVSAHALEGGTRYAEALAELFRQWFAQRDLVRDGLANLDADVIWYELGFAVRTPVLIDALLLVAGAEAWPAGPWQTFCARSSATAAGSTSAAAGTPSTPTTGLSRPR